MQVKSSVQSRQRGSVLALALIVVVLFFVSGLGMLSIGVQSRVFATRISDAIAARIAADAGLTRAVAQMNQQVGEQWFASVLPRSTDQALDNSRATYSYEMAVSSGSVTGGGSDPFSVSVPFTRRYDIRCVGKSGSAEKVVYATVKLEGLFESAILSQGELSLMPNTLITGYNSADPTDTQFDVNIGTTSTGSNAISLSPGTVVEGNIFVGVGSDPGEVIGDGGSIEGETFALTEPIQFPTITVPNLQNYGTVIEAKGSTVTLGPADSGTYSEIKLSSQGGNPGVLEIYGGEVVLHLTDKIALGNSAEIIIRAGSSLVLYVDGDISMGNSAGFVNESTSGRMLNIFSTGATTQSFELKAKSDMFGLVYAPNADVELYPNAELYGAISAKSVMVKSKGTFRYDEALQDVSLDDEGARFVIEKWWEE